MERTEALQESPRIDINSNELSGSISLKGARIDDLLLNKYRETVEPKSPKVMLLSPSATEKAYFAQFGWLGEGTTLPDNGTPWQSDSRALSPGKPVTLTWTNPENVTFKMVIALDKHFLFTIDQSVENKSGKELKLSPYGLINRSFSDTSKHFAILHEGPLGVTDGAASALATLTRLERLWLDHTGVGDGIVPVLKLMPQLEYLNLVGTKVSNAAIPVLGDLPQLKKLYVWNSAMTAEGVAALRQARPQLEVVFDEMPATSTEPAASAPEAPGCSICTARSCWLAVRPIPRSSPR